MADCTSAAVVSLRALLEAGAQRLDPVQFHYLEALATRIPADAGALRNHLEDRLQEAVEAYARRWDALAGGDSARPQRPSSGPSARLPGTSLQALQALNIRLREQARAGASADRLVDTADREEMKSVRQFRASWSRIAAQNRLQQALALGPDNAGPLNSHKLVLQALERMGAVSPHYVQRFMSHVDGLLLLDKVTPRLASGAAAPAKTRRKPKA